MCFSRLPECRAKAVIAAHRTLYYWGAQGPDVFYFYKYMKRGKKDLVELARSMHKQPPNILFVAFERYILTLSEGERDAATAYLLGFITHYFLDSATHPFIAYLVTAELTKGSRQSVSKIHVALEQRIGAMYYRALGKPGFKVGKAYAVRGGDLRLLDGLWRKVMQELYDYELPKNALRNCMKNNRFVGKLLFRRKFIIRSYLRTVARFKNRKTDADYPYKAYKTAVILNEERAPWPHIDGSVSAASVHDLFLAAASDACVLFSETLTALGQGTPLETSFESGFNRGFEQFQK